MMTENRASSSVTVRSAKTGCCIDLVHRKDQRNGSDRQRLDVPEVLR